ncbi:hypothetical protein CPC08DRAFT_702979 [Agrocybe pediades]|nr:hypothetical protein CPC08DRAFT_702979 [Agrocybe pediades]
MLRLSRFSSSSIRASARFYSESPIKVPIALIAELRKQTSVSLSKAREALSATNNNVADALAWLQEDLIKTGEAKAAKVASRETNQGLIATSILSQGAGLKAVGGVRAAMIELNCETDFVGRNELFAKLSVDIAHTAAFLSEAKSQEPAGFTSLSVEELSEAPLIAHDVSAGPAGTSTTTVHSAIRDAIVKVGENISLRRARAIIEDPNPANTTTALRLSSYIHNAVHSSIPSGPLAALTLMRLTSSNLPTLLRDEGFRSSLDVLERALSRQIAGSDPASIRGTSAEDDSALLNQSFFSLPGELNGLLVKDALSKWGEKHEAGIEVVDFSRWSVGGSESP